MIEALVIFAIASYTFCSGVFLMGCRVARMSWTKSAFEAAFWPIALIYEASKLPRKKP
jgi:hypothetical protein